MLAGGCTSPSEPGLGTAVWWWSRCKGQGTPPCLPCRAGLYGPATTEGILG